VRSAHQNLMSDGRGAPCEKSEISYRPGPGLARGYAQRTRGLSSGLTAVMRPRNGGGLRRHQPRPLSTKHEHAHSVQTRHQTGLSPTMAAPEQRHACESTATPAPRTAPAITTRDGRKKRGAFRRDDRHRRTRTTVGGGMTVLLHSAHGDDSPEVGGRSIGRTGGGSHELAIHPVTSPAVRWRCR